MPGLQETNFNTFGFKSFGMKRSLQTEDNNNVFQKRAKFDEQESATMFEQLPFCGDVHPQTENHNLCHGNDVEMITEDTAPGGLPLPTEVHQMSPHNPTPVPDQQPTASVPPAVAPVQSGSDAFLNRDVVRSYCRPNLDNFYRCQFYHDYLY